MRRLFKALKFFVTDTWASRKEAVDMPERREYYRDSSDIYGRGLGASGSSTMPPLPVKFSWNDSARPMP